MSGEGSSSSSESGPPKPYSGVSAGRAWLPSALLAVAVPSICYFLVFRYEQNFCQYYGVPDFLIRLDLSSALGFASAMYGLWIWIALFLALLSGGAWWRADESTSAIELLMRRRGLIFFYGAVLLYLYGPTLMGWMWIGTLLYFLVLGDLLPAFMHRNREGSFRRALDVSIRRWGETPSVFWPIRHHLGQGFIWLVILLTWAITLAGAMGGSAAARQEKYLVLSSDSTLAVIRVYGKQSICVGFDRKAKVIQPRLVIIEVGGPGFGGARLEKIGPLKSGKWRILDPVSWIR